MGVKERLGLKCSPQQRAKAGLGPLASFYIFRVMKKGRIGAENSCKRYSFKGSPHFTNETVWAAYTGSLRKVK